MAEEFHTPEEYHVPEEFHKTKEVYVSTPEFYDQPVGYGTTGKKSSSGGKSRSSQLRKMMMYLAATVTTMGTLMSFSSEAKTESFDKRDYLATHRDWYNAQDDEYIYLGDNGIGWIALGSEDGQTYDDFYHYRTWNYMDKDIDDYTCSAYAYEINWSKSPIDSIKTYAEWKLVKTDDGYVIDAYEPGHPEITKRIVPLDSSKDNYPGKAYMKDYYDLSMQELLGVFDTFVPRPDSPGYGDISKIKFNKDGTGSFSINGKNKSFTYTADDDSVSNFITIKHNGKCTRACFYFFGKKPTMMFFGGLLDMPEDGFSWFDATNEPKEKPAKKQTDPKNSTADTKPSSSETEPSQTQAKNIDAGPYLQAHRDWYSKSLKTYVFFGSNGMGYAFNSDRPDDDNFYSRFTYKISGSKCECVVESFNFPTMKYKTEKWTFTAMDVGGEIQLWSRSVLEKGEHQVFKEYSNDLDCYVDKLAGMSTGNILVKYRSFNIGDYSFVVNGITRLEFTGSNSGIIHYNEDGQSKDYTFTYSVSDNGITPTFNLYYNGENYLGQLFFARSGPGITLFNPVMDGTHGRFYAG